jgi:hypothetical protein
VPRQETLEAFIAAFATIGYTLSPGDDESAEAGVEKVALFVDPSGAPTHGARQLPDGYWTSKMGRAEDIRHPLRDVEGFKYGRVAIILRRTAQP